MFSRDKHLYEHLKITDWYTYEGLDFMITSDRRFVAGFEIDPPLMLYWGNEKKSDWWGKFKDNFYSSVADELWTQTLLVRDQTATDIVFNQLEEQREKEENVLLKKVNKRYHDNLKQYNPTSFKCFMCFGDLLNVDSKEFNDMSDRKFLEKYSRLRDIKEQVENWLSTNEINYQPLSKEKWRSEYGKALNPVSHDTIDWDDNGFPWPEEIIEEQPDLKPETPREKLLNNCARGEMFFEHDECFTRVLSLRKIPNRKIKIDTLDFLIDIPGPWIFSYTLINPGQTFLRSKFFGIRTMQQRWSKSSWDGKKKDQTQEIKDFGLDQQFSEADKVAKTLKTTPQRVVTVAIQVAITSRSKSDCYNRSKLFQRKFASKTLTMDAEDQLHHEQFLGSILHGLGWNSNRTRGGLSNSVLNMIPLNYTKPQFDPEANFYIITKQHEIAPLNLRRDGGHGCGMVAGPQGKGKSVYLNKNIVHTQQCGPLKGKTINVDHAGKNSSFINPCLLFGGKFNEVLKGKIKYNPFPHPKFILKTHPKFISGYDEKDLVGLSADYETTEDDPRFKSDLDPRMLNYATICIELAARIEPERRLNLRPIWKFGLENAYKIAAEQDRAITFSTLLDSLNKLNPTEFQSKDEIFQARKIIDNFCHTSLATIVNGYSNIDFETNFAVLDLEGLDDLDQEDQSLIAYITTQYVRQAVMEYKGITYVNLDEVPRYIKNDRMATLIGMLYSTARKNQGTVTMSFQQLSTLDSTPIKDIAINNSTNFALFPNPDEGQRVWMKNNLKLPDKALEAHANLKILPGKFAECLYIERLDGADSCADANITTHRHYVESYELEVVTSNPKDSELQRKVIAANPENDLDHILEHIAYKYKPKIRDSVVTKFGY